MAENRVINYAAPGAHVGIQADEIVITDGLNISMPSDHGSRGSGPGRTEGAQQGQGNVAGNGDVIGV